MNATAHALASGWAYGTAHALFSGSVAGTVHAKRREEKTPHQTTPDRTTPEVVSVETSASFVQERNARATATDDVLSNETIEHLDFTPEVSCESLVCADAGKGTHPADWWVQSHCRGPVALCDSDVQRQHAGTVFAFAWSACRVCGAQFPYRPVPILGRVR